MKEKKFYAAKIYLVYVQVNQNKYYFLDFLMYAIFVNFYKFLICCEFS